MYRFAESHDCEGGSPALNTSSGADVFAISGVGSDANCCIAGFNPAPDCPGCLSPSYDSAGGAGNAVSDAGLGSPKGVRARDGAAAANVLPLGAEAGCLRAADFEGTAEMPPVFPAALGERS